MQVYIQDLAADADRTQAILQRFQGRIFCGKMPRVDDGYLAIQKSVIRDVTSDQQIGLADAESNTDPPAPPQIAIREILVSSGMPAVHILMVGACKRSSQSQRFHQWL